jgi:hypothetical protein
MVMAMGSVAFFLYAFSFLQHRPKYECMDIPSGNWEPCTQSQFCKFDLVDGTGEYATGIKWRVNYMDQDSIHNLID